MLIYYQNLCLTCNTIHYDTICCIHTYLLIGFHGVDCSLRLCPSGRAWVDLPYENNKAHGNFTECSNMGKFIKYFIH